MYFVGYHGRKHAGGKRPKNPKVPQVWIRRGSCLMMSTGDIKHSWINSLKVERKTRQMIQPLSVSQPGTATGCTVCGHMTTRAGRMIEKAVQGILMHHRATTNREGSCLDDRQTHVNPLILAKISSLLSVELLTFVSVRIHCIYNLAVLSLSFIL